MLFASMMAATGTPWRREMLSSVSPRATMIGLPPSQVQVGGGDAGVSDPVVSALPGWYDPMPRPPPEVPSPLAPARCGIGRLSTPPLAPCGIEPVASREELLSEPKISDRRPESLLQLAVANAINAMATTRGPKAEQRDAYMVTRSHATLASSE